MVFAYVPATGTAGINTQLFISALLPEPVLLRCKGAGFLTPNPANGGSRKPERALATSSPPLSVFLCFQRDQVHQKSFAGSTQTFRDGLERESKPAAAVLINK